MLGRRAAVLQFISSCRALPEVLIATIVSIELTALAKIKRYLIIILLVSAEQQRVISMVLTLNYSERFRYRRQTTTMIYANIVNVTSFNII